MNISNALPAAIAVALLSGPVLAAPTADCPHAAAARLGASQGYERDRTAALEVEKRERASSDMIGKCVGGITSVVVVPTFPSLSDIFARAGERICHVASDRLREATTLPPLTVPGMPGLPGTAVPVLPFAAPVTPAAPANFWERIWR